MTGTSSTTERKLLTIKDLTSYEGTLFIRNNTDCAVSCNNSKGSLMLGRAGAEDSIQVLPPEVAGERGLVTLWKQGDVTISPDPEMEDELVANAEAANDRRQAEQDKLQSQILEAGNAKNLVPMRCLISGEQVFQTEQEIKDMVPPLADRFKDEARHYIPSVVPDPDHPGEMKTTWSRATVG